MGTWERPGASDEWYMPRYIFDALGCTFDCDVAASRHASHVSAARRISENSLDVPWLGFVWMNPPFGGRNGIEPWLAKFFEHRNGIALVPDRTSAPWFQKYAAQASAILFVSPKVKFERPDGTVGKSPAQGTALLAAGSRGRAALLRASTLGLVMVLACPA